MKRSKPHRQGARLWLANGLVPNLWVLVLVARYLAKGQVLVFGPGYRFLCPTKVCPFVVFGNKQSNTLRTNPSRKLSLERWIRSRSSPPAPCYYSTTTLPRQTAPNSLFSTSRGYTVPLEPCFDPSHASFGPVPDRCAVFRLSAVRYDSKARSLASLGVGCLPVISAGMQSLSTRTKLDYDGDPKIHSSGSLLAACDSYPTTSGSTLMRVPFDDILPLGSLRCSVCGLEISPFLHDLPSLPLFLRHSPVPNKTPPMSLSTDSAKLYDVITFHSANLSWSPTYPVSADPYILASLRVPSFSTPEDPRPPSLLFRMRTLHQTRDPDWG